MAKKTKKRRQQMPPLSVADKLIYWGLLLLLCAASFVLIFVPLRLRENIAFADTTVVALRDNIAVLGILVPWLTFFLMSFIFWQQAYFNRKPIFGKKNFKYGPPAWPKIYPLFMKNKPPVWVSERKKKQKKQIAILLAVILLLSFLPLPMSLYGRKCLYEDGSVAEYNGFNREIEKFTAEDMVGAKLETYCYRTKGSFVNHWGVQLTLETDSGEKFRFKHTESRNNTSAEGAYWMDALLGVKNCYYPGFVTYDGLENIDLVIYDKGLDPEESRKLYQLFGQ